jgi:hypothetical protein
MDRSYLVRTEEIDATTPQIWIYGGLVVALAYAINALLFSRLLKKAGQPIWKAWLPFVNLWTYFKIGGLKGEQALWLVGAIAAAASAVVVNNAEMALALYTVAAGLMAMFLVVYVLAGVNIQAKLGKPLPFIFLAVVNLIAPLWLWILALDYSKWNDKTRPKSRAN